jgi:hypothetical protein
MSLLMMWDAWIRGGTSNARAGAETADVRSFASECQFVICLI